ncbi:MAG: DUF4177 domain-containing protein [Rhodobacteraceae bacterium]|nr:DUF4177 domain-containing protein [Paracoccaceae bacterium]
MPHYEYRVVPAPVRGEKGKGLKTTADRFANAMTSLMNEMARDGWEYQRAETLPCEERKGLTGKAVTEQNVLVFRRATAETVLMDQARAAASAAPLQLHNRVLPDEAPRLRSVEPGQAPRLGPAQGEDRG